MNDYKDLSSDNDMIEDLGHSHTREEISEYAADYDQYLKENPAELERIYGLSTKTPSCPNGGTPGRIVITLLI